MKKLKQLNLLLIITMIVVFISAQPVLAKGASVSTHSSSSTVSRTSGSGFKSGSFSSSKSISSSTTSKSSSTSKNTSTTSTKSSSVTSSTKSVNTNSKALSSIPSSYSSHSVSNNYYYNVDNGGSNFWSNYWIYRTLTPDHRTYVVDNSNVVAPAYTGVKSIIPDLITIFVIIIIIGTAIYIIKKRRD